MNWVNEVGFLPLFAGDIPGFRQRNTSALMQGGQAIKPTTHGSPWRIIARSRQVVYGKFFDKKAGFINLDWLPVFANLLRDGCYFDTRWEEDLVGRLEHTIMELLIGRDENREITFPDILLLFTELKKQAGLAKGGERNFHGVLADCRCRPIW